MYKYIEDINNPGQNRSDMIYHPIKGYIPLIDGNNDYEEYKLWLDAGNTPEAF